MISITKQLLHNLPATALTTRNLTIRNIQKKVQVQPTVYCWKRFEDLFNKKIRLVSPERLDIWRSHFEDLNSDLISVPGIKTLNETKSWVTDINNYNTPHGKGIRAYQTILTDKYLCSNQSLENDRRVNALAWIMEVKQGAACIIDDILDASITRRDRMCWYNVDNKGFDAYNDGILLQSAPFVLLEKYFGNEKYYGQLTELYNFVIHAGVYGEWRDVRNAKLNNYETYNLEFYKNMMMFKNGYYTFFMPVAAAMIKNGISDIFSLKEVEKLSLEIALLYSIQDDYMDCFVDPQLTGKVGTDIEEGKCTWLFANALKLCSAQQRGVLLDNYCSKDQTKVEIIKGLYKDIRIPELYEIWEEETVTKIMEEIAKLSIINLQPLFYDVIAALCGRVR